MLSPTAIAGVVDLGGDPSTSCRRVNDVRDSALGYAGASSPHAAATRSGGRGRRPPSCAKCADASPDPGVAGSAATAVDEQAAFGASVIKVALKPSRGRSSTRTLAASSPPRAARASRRRARRGRGMTRLAVDAGIDVLAHAPFTERLETRSSPAPSRRAAMDLDAARSTTARYRARAAALDNLAPFGAAGGRVLYGTDLGNGEQPLGINVRELRRSRGGTAGHRSDRRAHRPLAVRIDVPNASRPSCPGPPPADARRRSRLARRGDASFPPRSRAR